MIEVSEKKRAANRANAQRSTGPKTPSGKQRSSRNAVTHGLLAKAATLMAQEDEQLQQLRAAYSRQFRPSTPEQRALVDELAATTYRLRQIPNIEAGMMTTAMVEIWQEEMGEDAEFDPQPETTAALQGLAFRRNRQSFSLLNRYEATLQRNFHRALDRLQKAHEMGFLRGPVETEAEQYETNPKVQSNQQTEQSEPAPVAAAPPPPGANHAPPRDRTALE